VKKLCLLMGLFMLAVLAIPGQASAQSVTRVAVSAPAAPVLVKPDPAMTPLRLAKEGSVLNVIASEGEWYRIEFQDPQFGRRVGYIEKRHVTVQMAAPVQEPADVTVAESSPARSLSGLEQPQIAQASVAGSVPTTPRQPTYPPAATLSQQNLFKQWGDVAVGYVFLYSDVHSMPLGFAASNAWRLHPNVDVVVEGQFSQKTFDFGFVSDAAKEWSVLGGPRFSFGSRSGQSTSAFGQVLAGMLSAKDVLSSGFYGYGVQPGFGVEVPVTRAVAIRPQVDLMIGRLQGETRTVNRFKVNVVFRLRDE
jgi:hypothetical protein